MSQSLQKLDAKPTDRVLTKKKEGGREAMVCALYNLNKAGGEQRSSTTCVCVRVCALEQKGSKNASEKKKSLPKRS